jgi:multidrug transporter EmrE-like cation transporter
VLSVHERHRDAVLDLGWIQVTRDADRAGSSRLNFAVDDPAQHLADVPARGLAFGAIKTVNRRPQVSRRPAARTMCIGRRDGVSSRTCGQTLERESAYRESRRTAPRFGGSALASRECSEDGPAVTSISLSVGVGLICALLSALGTNLAFLFKHRGAVAAPDVDMRHPLRSAVDLFRSKWWSLGWAVAAVAFALHVAALTLAPISIGQAVLAGGLVFLAVLAERFFGFELGRRQWIGIGLVAVSLTLLTLTGGAEAAERTLTTRSRA